MFSNFDRLLQLEDQPILHFLLVETKEHWNLLILTYFENSLKIFCEDSRLFTSWAILEKWSNYLVNCLQVPKHYALNVTDKVMPVLCENLDKMLKNLARKININEIQNRELFRHCTAISKFFSVFYDLEVNQSHLQSLIFAYELAKYPG